MTLVICAVFQLDAVASAIPNQTAALGATPLVWCAGSIAILLATNKKNPEISLYSHPPFSSRDGLMLFFVIAGGITMAVSNYLYAGLRPLFIRELLQAIPCIPFEISSTILRKCS